MPSFLPLKPLRETGRLLAFFHPEPDHTFHVILTPKNPIRSLVALDPADPFLGEMMFAVQSIVAEYHLPAYRLVVNGGKYQEFPHLHFHLISDAATPPPQ